MKGLISLDVFRRFVLNIFDCYLLDLVKIIVHLRSIFGGPDFMWLFWKSPIGLCLINTSYQQHIWWTRFHTTFLRKSVLNTWTYWTVSNKYYIPGPYLMNPILTDFFFEDPVQLFRSKIKNLLLKDLSNGLFYRNCRFCCSWWTFRLFSWPENFFCWLLILEMNQMLNLCRKKRRTI